MNYDKIVVGAGISGLVSAVTLLHAGYKVLLLDEHNNVGGMSKRRRKGRFEFGGSMHDLYLSKADENYTIKNVLKKCKIKDNLEWSSLPFLGRLITDDLDVTLPFGIDSYIDQIESIVPGSKNSLEIFFNLALECKEALNYINQNIYDIDYDYLKKEYNNFTRIANTSVSKVMDAIGVPLKAQELVNAMWILWGSSETEISFVTYGVFLYNSLSEGLRVLNHGTYDVAMCLANHFLECGGTLKLNSKVDKLLIDDGKINGVKLVDGTRYYSNHVIVNSNERLVYGNLVSLEDVPQDALKSINQREFGGRTFTIHLGLNRTALELGLDNYLYFLYDSMDTDVEYKRMQSINCTNQVAIVHNNANRNASEEGTCFITLSTVYFGNVYSKYVMNEDIRKLEQEIAYNLIKAFEEFTKINISGFIEEMEICSPLNNAQKSGYYDGADYGFALRGLDDILPRMLSKKNEKYIEGLEIVSGFDGDVYHYASSYAVDLRDEFKKIKTGGEE